MEAKIIITKTYPMWSYPFYKEFIHIRPKIVGIPTANIVPQKTNKLVIIRETENNGKSEQIIPIVVLAELIKLYPVTAIQIMLKWFNIWSKASIYLRIHDTIQRQTATAIFFWFCLLFESTIIRAKVINAINKAANVIDPTEDLKNHL